MFVHFLLLTTAIIVAGLPFMRGRISSRSDKKIPYPAEN